MSVQDVMKKSFLEEFQHAELALGNVWTVLLIAGLLGIYLFFIYRIVTINAFYSKHFNVSLILMCIITAAIIVAIQSSVVVSLGMVGALSIVRFRTAVKDPLDLIFMFWSISAGIICGAGMPSLAIMLSLFVTVLVLIFICCPELRKSMILVINASDNQCAEEIFKTVKKYDRRYRVKSRNLTKENTDFILETRVGDYESLLEDLNEIEGVISVSAVSHKGEAVY